MTQEELALLKLVKLHKGLSKNILFSYDNIDKLRLNGESKMRTHILNHFSSNKNKKTFAKSVGLKSTLIYLNQQITQMTPMVYNMQLKLL